MKNKEYPVLRISQIDWDKDHDDYEKLPKDIKLEWGSKEWSTAEVSEWLSMKFDWVLSSLKIVQIGTWKESGCCCAGGCSCC
jgi:hypothetical protein|tara:strand:- start:99 stop:344 length:246 start_codon:yes stop_codon:yes gene_type:complete